MSLLKVVVCSLFISFAFSGLILPSQIEDIIEQNSRTTRLDLADLNAPINGDSTANPVQGVQNATSGYLSVNDPKTNSKLFYVFYSCRGLKAGQSPKDVPVVIWLQGGPGSSSFLGSFFEFGPYRLEKSGSTYKEVKNERSWNDYYNLLIVDNPRGTGYSVADGNSYVTSEDQVGDDFTNALQNFYALDAFSSLSNTPLYIFGESYAGHYIPAIAKRVLQYNDGASKKIPLKGIGIGDGWTDPLKQLTNYATFGFSLGFIDYNEKTSVQKSQLLAIGNIMAGRYSQALDNFDDIISTIATGAGDVNVYNFRLFGRYDHSSLPLFFNNAENAKRYNVDSSRIGTYTVSNEKVYANLIKDFMTGVQDRVAYVANAGLPVLLYNGQYDLIVNTPTVLNWIGELDWKGKASFYNAPLQSWIYKNGSTVGLAKNYQNFTFVIMNKAGHLAPMDQLEPSIEMLRRFVAGNNQWNKTFSG